MRNNEFRHNLKELRFMRKMTQFELAAKLGVSRSSINEWEAGRCEPSLGTLVALSKILAVEYKELLE